MVHVRIVFVNVGECAQVNSGMVMNYVYIFLIAAIISYVWLKLVGCPGVRGFWPSHVDAGSGGRTSGEAQ